MQDVRYNFLLHRTAQLTAAATLLLIFMGGLVTSHGAGMSVPDWPNSYGYNMFTFPPSKWIGGIFYEHTHRLMGTVVGMLSIALTIIAWKGEPRKWVRWLATSVLFAVIFQGILGGLRVVLVKLDLAIIHACVAQAFFCLTALVAVVTSKWWHTAPEYYDPLEKSDIRRLILLDIACTVAIYLQIFAGATMRHYGAGLAIPDFPLNFGKLLPPTDSASLDAANNFRQAFFLNTTTLTSIWLHFSHRIGAIIVATLIVSIFILIMRRDLFRPLRHIAWLLLILLFSQISLG